MTEEEDFALALPPAPPGGGYLVFSPLQAANEKLLAAIRKYYSQTKIVIGQQLPTE